MSNNLSLEELLPIMTETLAAGGEVVFTPGGNSMLPLLHGGRDIVTLVKPNGSLQKYDLPLYRRSDGRFVLHRIVGRNADGYLMRGDNTFFTETGITDTDIIGVVISFERKGKKVSCDSMGYRLYSRIWVALYPIRRFILSAKQLPRRVYRKLLGKKED